MADRDHLSWISSEPLRRAKSAIAVAVSFAIILGAVGFGSWKAYSFYMDWLQHDDYIGEGEDPVSIIIKPGDGWSKVGNVLLSEDVVKDPSLFVEEAQVLAPDGPNKPGIWNLKTHLPAKTAAEMLNDPSNRVTIGVTIPEGLRLASIYPILIDKVGMTQADIDQTIESIKADPSVVGLNPAAENNPEGYLFPDTYYVYPEFNANALGIFQQMAKEFNDVAAELDIENRAAELGYSVQQMVVVASIIEGEVQNDEDRAKVARAIYNRLAIGMPLGVESAFRYGRLVTDGTPYDDDITIDSQMDASLPYNYYINPGLPASPIDNPGRAALQAALNPAEGDWLYWVTVNLFTGETQFASDDEGFQVLNAQFHQWCADNGEPVGCS